MTAAAGTAPSRSTIGSGRLTFTTVEETTESGPPSTTTSGCPVSSASTALTVDWVLAPWALALVIMPVLARMKRQQAQRMNNRALAADATQSATCAYLAAVTLGGLAIYAVWHIRWVDTIAALVPIPIILIEGRRAWRGEGCGCP